VKNLRIGVVGAGATGGFLAGKLADAGYRVTLVARGESLKQIQKEGIHIDGPNGQSITAKPESVIAIGDQTQPVDVAIFCVKSYSTDDAAARLEPLIGAEGKILCLQNGVVNEDILARRFGEERVLAGVLYIGCQREAPGHITVTAPAKIQFGSIKMKDDNLVAGLKAAFDDAEIETVVEENILQSKWQKFLFNCGLNPLTALTGMKMGELIDSNEGAALYEALVDEALAAAKAVGAPLATDARKRAIETARRMNISSSMAEDLAAGRPIERGAFTGFVCQLGERTGVATPVTWTFDRLLALRDPGGAFDSGTS
jgi:2-dehydropantoate 2-reductase